jgi:hypothetical protein
MHLDILSHFDPWTARGRCQFGAQIFWHADFQLDREETQQRAGARACDTKRIEAFAEKAPVGITP